MSTSALRLLGGRIAERSDVSLRQEWKKGKEKWRREQEIERNGFRRDIERWEEEEKEMRALRQAVANKQIKKESSTTDTIAAIAESLF